VALKQGGGKSPVSFCAGSCESRKPPQLYTKAKDRGACSGKPAYRQAGAPGRPNYRKIFFAARVINLILPYKFAIQVTKMLSGRNPIFISGNIGVNGVAFNQSIA